jgi:hypothetical protein
LVIKTEMLFILSIQLQWLPVNIFHTIK